MLKTPFGKKNKKKVEEEFRKLAFLLRKDVADSTREAIEKGKWILTYEKKEGYRIVETVDSKGHFHFPLGEMYFPPRLFVDVLDFTIKAISQKNGKTKN